MDGGVIENGGGAATAKVAVQSQPLRWRESRIFPCVPFGNLSPSYRRRW
jgi:hypothetical protein